MLSIKIRYIHYYVDTLIIQQNTSHTVLHPHILYLIDFEKQRAIMFHHIHVDLKINGTFTSDNQTHQSEIIL